MDIWRLSSAEDVRCGQVAVAEICPDTIQLTVCDPRSTAGAWIVEERGVQFQIMYQVGGHAYILEHLLAFWA